MTSEGQHAGHRPGATSGTGADQFGPDGFPPDAFPPDSDGHRTADRPPSYPHAQESLPSAYAPPPQSTPNGGSPFVVPAVPPAGQGAGSAVPGSPAAQPPGFPPPPSQPPGFPPPPSQPPGFPASGAGQPGLPQRGPQTPGFPQGEAPRGSQPSGFPGGDDQRGSQPPGFPAADSQRGSQPPGFPPSGLPQRGSQRGSQPGGSPAPGSPAPGFPPPTFSSRAAQPAGFESPAFPPPTFSSRGAQPAAPSSSSGAPSGSPQPPSIPPPGASQPPSFPPPGASQPPSFPPPGAQPPSGSPAVGRQGPASPAFGAQRSGPPPAGAQSAGAQSAGEQPGPAFGPGAAQFTSASSGSARVPEPGALPQRPPAAPEPPQSAWAPPPSAQPSGAAEENPFARQAEAHPYRSGGGDLPQRSPGVPLDGPVGDFNGFTPTRQTADSGPDRRPAFEQPAAREQFAPAPREPGGDGFGSARTDDDRSGGDRPPGLSAFGDQRVRVPGATLTGLPDAPPAGADGDSGAFPARDSGDSGGFPIRGGSGNGSFPIRGAGVRSGDGFGRDDDSGALSARNAGFAPREDPDNDKFARRDDDAFPGRGDGNGAFSAREAIENGSLPARGDVDSDGFPGGDRPDSNPFRDGSFRREDADGDFLARGGDPFGRFGSEQSSDGPGGNGYAQRVPGASFAPAGPPDGASSGYPQRVPGASLGSSGSPVAAGSRSAASVPQPRDPAERPESGEAGPAKGTARPVSASASVPVASRVSPPGDAEELPPPPVASPQSRVYGRPAPADDEPAAQPAYRDEDQPVSGGFGAAPISGARGPAPTSGAYGQAAEQFPGATGGTGPASGSPYGRPAEQFPGATGGTGPASGSPYGRPDEVAENPYARPTDGTYGKPASADGTYGRPPEAPWPSSGASPFADSPDGFDDAAGQPGRPAGRASASARVSPPAQPFAPASPAPGQAPDPGNAVQFTEFTTDIAGRGRPGQVPGNPAARTTPPDQYSENTTDVSGRGQGSEQPYVPAPALPSMHAAPPLENGFPPAQAPDSTQPFGERPRMGGVYPGPASRATVTPPGPDQTAAWPGRPESDADQGRFDSFKQDAPEIVPTEVAKPETPHVRMLPVILGVILGAALIVGLTLGVTWLIARGSHEGGSGFSVSAGDCVKRDGNEAVTANCSDPGSFEVTAIKNTKEECPDPNQPYVVNPTDNGRSQVLCLKPRP